MVEKCAMLLIRDRTLLRAGPDRSSSTELLYVGWIWIVSSPQPHAGVEWFAPEWLFSCYLRAACCASLSICAVVDRVAMMMILAHTRLLQQKNKGWVIRPNGASEWRVLLGTRHMVYMILRERESTWCGSLQKYKKSCTVFRLLCTARVLLGPVVCLLYDLYE